MTRPARRGRFITFEGGEGAGKSTQARRLAKAIADRGLECVVTREPGGTPRAEALREFILSGAAARFGAAGEALLFGAARIDHLDTLIAPALARGAWVVCDRFVDSTRAYQGAAGKLDPAMIAALERISVGAAMPDLTLILDLPVEAGMARAEARGGAAGGKDRFEREGVDFHKTLRQAFLDIAAAEPGRCVVVDAAKSVDQVARRVWAAVTRHFGGELPERAAQNE